MWPLKFPNSRELLLHLYSFFFKVCGIFPWNIALFCVPQSSATDQNNRAIRKSYCNYFYNTFLIILYTIMHIGLYTQVHETTDVTGTTIVARRCLVSYGIITTLMFWIHFVVQHEIIYKVVDQLAKVDQVLISCKGYILVENSGILYLVFINFFMCLAASVLQFATRPLIVIFIWTIPATLCNWVLTQYSLIIHILLSRLKSTNDCLLKLNKIPVDLESKSILFEKSPIIESIDTEITNIKHAYMYLYAICHQIVSFYTLPTLFAIIFLCFLSLYFAYFFLITYFELVPFFITERVMQLLWIILTYYILIILSTHVNIFSNERKRTVDIIHWILNTHRMDKTTEKELKEFSQQLLYESIPFKVYDLMVLDGSLLYVTISTAISYLIILIQFRFYNYSHT